MKKVAVFLKLPEITDYPLSKEDYKQSYFELKQEVEKLGMEYFIVRGQVSYAGNGKFTRSWQYDQDQQFHESGEITADVIFDKGEFISDETVPVFNHSFINQVCTDKWMMYTLFPELCPKTILVQTADELVGALNNISTELAVIKPIDGEEGRDVYIDKPNQLLERVYAYPLLVQEFLDSSGGIPGIVEGLHDFRVALVDGEIFYSYVRTPPQGSYLANVARGGTFAMVEPQDVPQAAQEICTVINSKLAEYGHSFYGIDFAFTPDGPRIIEMNSRLGLLPNKDAEVFMRLKQKLAQIFLDMAV